MGRSQKEDCGSDSIEIIGTPEALQQAELPDVRAIVTEYLLHKYLCNSCGKRSTADLPVGVPDSAFGPRLMGLFATLTGVLPVAKQEAIQLMKDLYDVDIGLGSAPNIEERVSKALDPVYRRIHNLVIEGDFWFSENKEAAKAGGNIAGNARKELEEKSGRKVVCTSNFLNPTISEEEDPALLPHES